MKSIKELRENFDLITEKEEKEGQKLSALVRAGLYDAKKLPALKKALEKSADKMTGQEKRMLLNLLDSLISQVTSDEQIYRKVKQNVHTMNEAKEDHLTKFDPRFKQGYPSDRDIPTVLILKRKAIRVYPDNQKVALYYSQALDKYVTVPFSDIQTGVNEEVKPEEKKKKKRAAGFNATEYLNRRNQETRKKAHDAAHLVGGKGEYSSPVKRFAAVRSRVGTTGGAIGVMINDKFRKRAIQKALANRRANPKPKPAALNENPLALLGAAARVAAPYAARAATVAGSVAGSVGRSALDLGKRVLSKWKNKKVDKAKEVKKPKVPKKKGKDRLGLAANLAGAAASGSGGAQNQTSAETGGSRQYNFGLKAKTGSSWENKADSQASQRMRDQRLARQSQAAVLKENSVLSAIRDLADNKITEHTVKFDEQEININNTVAKKILHVYESVNTTNKKKMEKMLNESAESFTKVLTFAIRQ